MPVCLIDLAFVPRSCPTKALNPSLMQFQEIHFEEVKDSRRLKQVQSMDGFPELLAPGQRTWAALEADEALHTKMPDGNPNVMTFSERLEENIRSP